MDGNRKDEKKKKNKEDQVRKAEKTAKQRNPKQWRLIIRNLSFKVLPLCLCLSHYPFAAFSPSAASICDVSAPVSLTIGRSGSHAHALQATKEDIEAIFAKFGRVLEANSRSLFVVVPTSRRLRTELRELTRSRLLYPPPFRMGNRAVSLSSSSIRERMPPGCVRYPPRHASEMEPGCDDMLLRDDEQAMSALNAQPILDRPVAVDWALAKDHFIEAARSESIEAAQEEKNEEKEEQKPTEMSGHGKLKKEKNEAAAKIKKEESEMAVKVKKEKAAEAEATLRRVKIKKEPGLEESSVCSLFSLFAFCSLRFLREAAVRRTASQLMSVLGIWRV